MFALDENRNDTVFGSFAASAKKYPDALFLIIPPLAHRDYLPEGCAFSYSHAMAHITQLRNRYEQAGYGLGHRVALLLGNRPEFLFHYLALNGLGASIVPVNPDYQSEEIRYILDHSDADMIVSFGKYIPLLRRLTELSILNIESLPNRLAPARKKASSGAPGLSTECSLLYTSGTTGLPKGCILTNHYHLYAGQWYCHLGGLMSLRTGEDRLYNPLPLFHMNNLAISLTAMILSGNCLILPERFSPRTWWIDIAGSKATAFHYLGIIPPLLLNQGPCAEEKDHHVRFGAGAGIDPKLHRMFEERYGFPMIEIWGMTETGRIFADHTEPRQIHCRAFGRAPLAEFEAKIVNDKGVEMPRGREGELLVRAKGPDPRSGFFSGYLKDNQATEEAWRGGWFHTGDIATHQPDGMLIYVDRRKNIIRRSGENIAAAEIETIIQGYSKVAQVAVLAVPDELREEEIMACIVPKKGVDPGPILAQDIFRWCMEHLAYFKAPGWILFLEELPVTSTQKVRKTQIFPPGSDPRTLSKVIDLRSRKKRG